MNNFQPRNPSVDGGLAALIFDVGFENFESGSSDRAKKEAARPLFPLRGECMPSTKTTIR